MATAALPDDATTLTSIVPLFPSLVAVTVEVPTLTPVTTPLATVATDGWLLLHETVRPLSDWPAASLRIAWTCSAEPTGMASVCGLRVTVATGAVEVALVIVTVTEPLTPSHVAVMTVDPGATAVTIPSCTTATLVLELVYVTVRPVSTFPDASVTTAANEIPWFTRNVAGAAGSVTFATAAFTVSAALLLRPSTVAVIIAAPPDSPVTFPATTDATVGLELAQLTVRPVRTLPDTSRGVAVSCSVPPTIRLALLGETVTDAASLSPPPVPPPVPVASPAPPQARTNVMTAAPRKGGTHARLVAAARVVWDGRESRI